MFVIFINDLPQHIQSALPFVYADDTNCLLAQMILVNFKAMSIIQLCVATLQTYYLMKPNLCMFVIGLNHPLIWAPQHTQLMENLSSNSYNTRILVPFLQQSQLDRPLSNYHYTKAYQIVGLIRPRVRHTFMVNCIEAKEHLYISLARSQIMYCSQIWKPQLIRDITSLEHVLCAA